MVDNVILPRNRNSVSLKLVAMGGRLLNDKAELVEKVANQINLTKKQTEVVVKQFFQVLPTLG
ncbi:MAG: hypothetical protein CM1200mP16_07520 [Nitrospina sp.]|nr:MAG: hypothetical protein CM1200mP16_07520 [Nitrospina sp.]